MARNASGGNVLLAVIRLCVVTLRLWSAQCRTLLHPRCDVHAISFTKIMCIVQHILILDLHLSCQELAPVCSPTAEALQWLTSWCKLHHVVVQAEGNQPFAGYTYIHYILLTSHQ
jgi:hypothetical protein